MYKRILIHNRLLPYVNIIVISFLIFSIGCTIVNQSPIILNITASAEQVNPSQTIKINCEARDADRDNITYTWSATEGTISGNGPEVEWKAPEKSGDYTIDVMVSDSKGGEATKGITINVLAKNTTPPFIKNVTYEPNKYEIFDDEKVTFKCVAISSDGFELSYYWEVSGGKIDGTGSSVVWITPIVKDNSEDHTVSVYAKDSTGNRSAKKFLSFKIFCDCLRVPASTPTK